MNLNLGIGLGLRATHYSHLLSHTTQIDWLEATSENYLGLGESTGGKPIRTLEKLREKYPIVLHGVSLSIGSTDPLNLDYLQKLKSLMTRIEPEWVSDHLCWTGVDGRNNHDLLPLPYTEEVIRHLVERIHTAQEFLGRRLVFENVSSYLTFSHSEMTEWEFVSEVARRSGSGILLDINNLYVSSVNHGFEAQEYLHAFAAADIAQIHLAGHSAQDGLLIDTHDAPVCEEVWALYEKAVQLFGPVPTMIERDAKIPAFQELELEALRIRQIQEDVARGERSMKESKMIPSLDSISLRSMQRSMQWLIQDARGVPSATGHTSSPRPSAFPWIESMNQVSAAVRLTVYADGYLIRIVEALKSDFKILFSLLGQNKFYQLVSDYLEIYPSQSFNLGEVGRSLSLFLEARLSQDGRSDLAEIAQFEWHLCESFFAEDSAPMDLSLLADLSEEVLAGLRFQLDPSVFFFTSTWQILSLWRGQEHSHGPVLQGENLLIHRDHNGFVQVYNPEALEWQALQKIQQCQTLGELSQWLESQAPQSAALLIQQWFQAWVCQKIVTTFWYSGALK